MPVAITKPHFYLSIQFTEFPFDASVKSSPDKGTLFNVDTSEDAKLLDKLHTDAVSLTLLLCSSSFLMMGDIQTEKPTYTIKNPKYTVQIEIYKKSLCTRKTA